MKTLLKGAVHVHLWDTLKIGDVHVLQEERRRKKKVGGTSSG